MSQETAYSREKLPEWLLGISVLLFVFFRILTAEVPRIPPPDQPLLRDILEGNEKNIPKFGSEFELFKPYIDANETYSFIMDVPFNNYGKIAEHIYAAQSVLAPVLLNPHPVEKAALVDCSNSAIAMHRLEQTGYTLVRALENGKGLAVKKS